MHKAMTQGNSSTHTHCLRAHAQFARNSHARLKQIGAAYDVMLAEKTFLDDYKKIVHVIDARAHAHT